MSFYTSKGDDGTTGLIGEGRVPKYHDRMEALGALDEAGAALLFSKVGRKDRFWKNNDQKEESE